MEEAYRIIAEFGNVHLIQTNGESVILRVFLKGKGDKFVKHIDVTTEMDQLFAIHETLTYYKAHGRLPVSQKELKQDQKRKP